MAKRMNSTGVGGPARLVIAALAALTAAVAIVTAPSAAPESMVKLSAPGFPTVAITAFGSLWVGTHDGSTLYRIDPRTGGIVAKIHVGDNTCWLSAGGDRVWMQSCGGDVYIRAIDPATNALGPIMPYSAPYFGGGSMWAANGPNTALLRLDPRTHVLIKRFPLHFDNPSEASLAGFAYGSAWAGDQGSVTRVEAATNTLTVIPLPGAKLWPDPGLQVLAAGAQMAFAGGKVFYANPAGIYQIDPATNVATLLPGITIGSLDEWGNIDLASGAGSVWARTSGTQVTRIDPVAGTVLQTYPASGGGGAVVVADGRVWVTNASSNSIWGEPIH